MQVAAVTKPELALAADADADADADAEADVDAAAAAGYAGREEQQPSGDSECACTKQGDEWNSCEANDILRVSPGTGRT